MIPPASLAPDTKVKPAKQKTPPPLATPVDAKKVCRNKVLSKRCFSQGRRMTFDDDEQECCNRCIDNYGCEGRAAPGAFTKKRHKRMKEQEDGEEE